MIIILLYSLISLGYLGSIFGGSFQGTCQIMWYLLNTKQFTPTWSTQLILATLLLCCILIYQGVCQYNSNFQVTRGGTYIWQTSSEIFLWSRKFVWTIVNHSNWVSWVKHHKALLWGLYCERSILWKYILRMALLTNHCCWLIVYLSKFCNLYFCVAKFPMPHYTASSYFDGSWGPVLHPLLTRINT